MVTSTLSVRNADHSTAFKKSPSKHAVISTIPDHRNNGGGDERENGEEVQASTSTEMLMPNSPTSLASQSRRMRLKSSSSSNSSNLSSGKNAAGKVKGLNTNPVSPDSMEKKRWNLVRMKGHSSYSPQFNNDYQESSMPSTRVADLKKVFESKSQPSSSSSLCRPKKAAASAPNIISLEAPSQPTPERFNDSNANDNHEVSPSKRKINRCAVSLSPTKKREKTQMKYNKVNNQSHFLDHQAYLEQQRQPQYLQQEQHISHSTKNQEKFDESSMNKMNDFTSLSMSKQTNKKIVIQVKDGIQIGGSSLPSKKNSALTFSKRDMNENENSNDQIAISDESISPPGGLFANRLNSAVTNDKEGLLLTQSKNEKQQQQQNYQQESEQVEEKESGGSPASTNGTLSDRRRKMAKAKKHARSTTNPNSLNSSSPSDNQIFSTSNDDDHAIMNDSTHTISNIVRTSSSQSSNSDQNHHHHQQQQQQYQWTSVSSPSSTKRHQTVVSFQDSHEMDTPNHVNDGSNKSKFQSSPSRRRKFDLVKESMKQKRNHNQVQQPQQQHQSAIQTSHDGSNSSWKQDMFTTTTTTNTTNSTMSSLTSLSISKQNDMSTHGYGNSPTANTSSTASMSASTFETFETGFNSIHHQQQQQQISSSIQQKKKKSGAMKWGIDEIVPNQAKLRKMEQVTPMQNNCARIPSDELNNNPTHSIQSDFQPFGQISNEFVEQPINRSVQSNVYHHEEKIPPATSSQHHGSLDFINNYHNQNPKYFAPPNTNHHTGNTWDDDDETQFNSVAENPEKKKTNLPHNVDTGILQIHPLQSNTMSTRSERSASASYFSSGFITRKTPEFPMSGSYTTGGNGGGEDDESYTGSVGNKSWTGRMRARQATEFHGGGMMTADRRDSMRYESPSKRSLYSIEDNNTEYSRFSTSQLLTRDIGNNAAFVDATKGVEEFKKFAKDDPTSAAVGVGVCGALCGALAFGTAGFILAVGTVGACYGVSQLPQDKRNKMKKKASSTVEKIKSHTESASDFVTSNCGCGGESAGSQMKPVEGEYEIKTFGVSITPNGESKTGIPKLTPPNERVPTRKSPRKVKPIRNHLHHTEPQQSDKNTLLMQASKRNLSRMTPACCRMSRITPVNQIHSLDPALHSRAWLDVMASAWTSRDEKNEAMEEILLLAKDKNRARMLLEVRININIAIIQMTAFLKESKQTKHSIHEFNIQEGILDSLMYILRAFFESYAEKLSHSGLTELPLEMYMGDPNYFHSKLAANCCVALAKAYTVGSLPSQDSNEYPTSSTTTGASFPISKQVAQMLHEVPHHMAVKNPDAAEGEKKEMFKLTTEMTFQIAEDLASSITALTMGKIDILMSQECI